MSLNNILSIFEKSGFVKQDYQKSDKFELLVVRHPDGVELTIAEDEFGTVTTKLVESK